MSNMKNFNADKHCVEISSSLQSLTLTYDQEKYLNTLLMKIKDITDKHALQQSNEI